MQVRNPLVPQRALRKVDRNLKARAPESRSFSAPVWSARSGSEIFKPTSVIHQFNVVQQNLNVSGL